MTEDKSGEKEQKKTFSSGTRAVIWIVVLGTLFLMVFISVKLIALQQEYEAYSYNHFDFVNIDNMWYTQIQLGRQPWKVPMRFGPRDVEYIPVVGDPDIMLTVKVNYITFDPEEEPLNYTALAASELSLNLAQALDIRPEGACTKNITEACHNRTIISCETDKTHAIIYLTQDSDFPIVEQKDNCLIVKGKGFDLVKAVDRLLLYWYEIMP